MIESLSAYEVKKSWRVIKQPAIHGESNLQLCITCHYLTGFEEGLM